MKLRIKLKTTYQTTPKMKATQKKKSLNMKKKCPKKELL